MIVISQLGQSERNKFFYEALGLRYGAKLPHHAIAPRPLPGTHGLLIGLRAIGEFGPRTPSGRQPRRMSHRVYLICPCGQELSAGRLEQHMKGRTHA